MSSGNPVVDTAAPRARLRLTDALRIANAAAGMTGRSGEVHLAIACGCTPLHLETFVRAYALMSRPDRVVRTSVGIYGDLVAAIEDVSAQPADALLVLVEWTDLDPRLSARRAGRVAIPPEEEVLATVADRLSAVEQAVLAAADEQLVVVSLALLPLTPLIAGRSGQLGTTEARLRAQLLEHASRVAAHRNVRVLSAPTAQLELHSQLVSDFPYSVADASDLAHDLVRLALPAPPKKGLITDLDDTLWSGLVGEVGRDGISWDLDEHSQAHALYQQLLAILADEGVLLGVVSKNDQRVVTDALTREDLVVSADSLFPVVASWEPKSGGVEHVLRTWNIGAGDVVFVDDNPVELAEVASAHPAITTLRFEPRATGLFAELRDLFYRDHVTTEDSLRAQSIKTGTRFSGEQKQAMDQASFLRSLTGRLTLRTVEPDEARPYELVQKTNQFNLNGRRQERAHWRRLLEEPGRITIAAEYVDRFGALGTVSVLSGTATPNSFLVDCWVLSCRAFSRAIEHHLIAAMLELTGAARVDFDFEATARNDVLTRFLAVTTGAQSPRPTIDAEALTATGLAELHEVDSSAVTAPTERGAG